MAFYETMLCLHFVSSTKELKVCVSLYYTFMIHLTKYFFRLLEIINRRHHQEVEPMQL